MVEGFGDFGDFGWSDKKAKICDRGSILGGVVIGGEWLIFDTKLF